MLRREGLGAWMFLASLPRQLPLHGATQPLVREATHEVNMIPARGSSGP